MEPILRLDLRHSVSAQTLKQAESRRRQSAAHQAAAIASCRTKHTYRSAEPIPQSAIRNPQSPGPILVAVTGYGQEGDRERAKAAGFDYHLTKPVDPEDLKAFLASLSPEQGSDEGLKTGPIEVNRAVRSG